MYIRTWSIISRSGVSFPTQISPAISRGLPFSSTSMRHRHENVTLQPHLLLRMPQPNGSSVEPAPTVEVSKLSYAFQDGSPGLQDINLKLPPQSRTLLIGGMHARPLPVLPTIPAPRTLSFSKESPLTFAPFLICPSSQWRRQNNAPPPPLRQTSRPNIHHLHCRRRPLQRRPRGSDLPRSGMGAQPHRAYRH